MVGGGCLGCLRFSLRSNQK